MQSTIDTSSRVMGAKKGPNAPEDCKESTARKGRKVQAQYRVRENR